MNNLKDVINEAWEKKDQVNQAILSIKNQI